MRVHHVDLPLADKLLQESNVSYTLRNVPLPDRMQNYRCVRRSEEIIGEDEDGMSVCYLRIGKCRSERFGACDFEL